MNPDKLAELQEKERIEFEDRMSKLIEPYHGERDSTTQSTEQSSRYEAVIHWLEEFPELSINFPTEGISEPEFENIRKAIVQYYDCRDIDKLQRLTNGAISLVL